MLKFICAVAQHNLMIFNKSLSLYWVAIKLFLSKTTDFIFRELNLRTSYFAPSLIFLETKSAKMFSAPDKYLNLTLINIRYTYTSINDNFESFQVNKRLMISIYYKVIFQRINFTFLYGKAVALYPL